MKKKKKITHYKTFKSTFISILLNQANEQNYRLQLIVAQLNRTNQMKYSKNELILFHICRRCWILVSLNKNDVSLRPYSLTFSARMKCSHWSRIREAFILVCCGYTMTTTTTTTRAPTTTTTTAGNSNGNDNGNAHLCVDCMETEQDNMWTAN